MVFKRELPSFLLDFLVLAPLSGLFFLLLAAVKSIFTLKSIVRYTMSHEQERRLHAAYYSPTILDRCACLAIRQTVCALRVLMLHPLHSSINKTLLSSRTIYLLLDVPKRKGLTFTVWGTSRYILRVSTAVIYESLFCNVICTDVHPSTGHASTQSIAPRQPG